MPKQALVTQTEQFVKDTLGGDGTGHDWWHVYRVVQLAKHIARQETGVNMLVVELGALLHDIADWKFHNGDTTVGPRVATEWLTSCGVDPEVMKSVVYIVQHISYRGGANMHKMQTLEGKIVQDADRLDGMGALGIARTFTFGGARGLPIYDPTLLPRSPEEINSYQKLMTNATTINHFYEKLLLLKDGMHTKTAQAMASQRHEVMLQFLDQFYAEWEGKR